MTRRRGDQMRNRPIRAQGGECVVSFVNMGLPLSLAPGFSRVLGRENSGNRFSGFWLCCSLSHHLRKPLKRLSISSPWNTRLKPGANEIEPGMLRAGRVETDRRRGPGVRTF